MTLPRPRCLGRPASGLEHPDHEPAVESEILNDDAKVASPAEPRLRLLILAEYQRAPQVTRDRMYLETMQQIYGNVTKVMVETRQGSNMLFLPLDKILQQVAQGTAAAEPVPPPATTAPAAGGTIDPRTRDNARSRERESR